jgi:uncharacterized protein
VLEALLQYDPELPARFSAVVCHPHPLFGGSMHNKVVFRAARAALLEGIPALRFNFRGVGKSAGAFADGIGEEGDVRAALDYVSSRFAGSRVVLMGFSFGSGVGLRVGAVDKRVVALVGLGVAVTRQDYSVLKECLKPKLIVQGTLDEFGPRADVLQLFDSLHPPKKIHWVEGAGHFFHGRLGEVVGAVRSFLHELAEPRNGISKSV